jgi:hypothetical protein
MGEKIIGLSNIAALLHKDEKTVRRWIAKGYQKLDRAEKCGPFPNSPIMMDASHVREVRAKIGITDEQDGGDGGIE